MQIFIYCKATLHVLGVTAPITRVLKTVTTASGTGINTGAAISLCGLIGTGLHKPVPIRPLLREVAAPVL